MANGLSQGVGDFVKALTGRGAIRQEAQRSAIRDLDDLARGEILADEFRSRGALGDNLTAAGIDPKQAAILSSVFRAGAGNFQQGSAGLGNLADLALLNKGEALAESPSDLDKLNRIIALRANKPLQRTEITGNTAFDPFAAPTGQDLISTPLGDSMIAENLAQGQAAVTRANRPSRSSGGRVEKFSQPTQGSLRNAFGKGKGEIDQPRYNLFLRWRQDNPEIRNGEEALQAFLTGSDVFTINETGAFRPNPNRYRPEEDGIPEVDTGRSIGDALAGETYYQDASGQQRPVPSNRQAFREAFSIADELKAEAQAAIAAGADPEKVRQRLKAEILRRTGQ